MLAARLLQRKSGLGAVLAGLSAAAVAIGAFVALVR
jgi:hypothetical protein